MFTEGSGLATCVTSCTQNWKLSRVAAPKSAYKNYNEHSRLMQSLEKWLVLLLFFSKWATVGNYMFSNFTVISFIFTCEWCNGPSGKGYKFSRDPARAHIGFEDQNRYASVFRTPDWNKRVKFSANESLRRVETYTWQIVLTDYYSCLFMSYLRIWRSINTMSPSWWFYLGQTIWLLREVGLILKKEIPVAFQEKKENHAWPAFLYRAPSFDWKNISTLLVSSLQTN